MQEGGKYTFSNFTGEKKTLSHFIALLCSISSLKSIFSAMRWSHYNSFPIGRDQTVEELNLQKM